ncbi:MAG: PDDEXK nuclease domain-containing protein [Prevotellaceae bacterium]|jgi:predicted nuclease of restriction endonuclease-like (RecB) superfamily|nr:PDDEXK nuclease domain-containing protein [Prevotellaceae bacterium]
MDIAKQYNEEYKQWLTDLKLRIRQSQIKASVKVNTEMLHLYWDLGQDIVSRQMDSTWGSGFFEQLSKDLHNEFPHMKGFSIANLRFTKRFYLFYNQSDTILHQVGAKLEKPIQHQLGSELQSTDNQSDTIRQQVVSELENHPIFQIPWGHHIQIFTKCKSIKEALFYVQKTIQDSWSRAVLMNVLETDLYNRQGKSLTNFSRLLPEPQSDLANEIVKDPYNFDFITLAEPYKERELEDALTENITKFLLELGQGFAYVGRQVPVKVGDSERFIDLLFYHLDLQCYVVIELKATKFEAEFAGKLGLYVAAINHQRKKPTDNPTIGMIVCKTKDNIEVEYSLESSSQPIGVSEYQLSKLLPDNYKSALPSIEEIEEGLKG